MPEMNYQSMFTEALRMGEQSAGQAARYMSLSIELMKGLSVAMKFLECGKARTAYETLEAARQNALAKLKGNVKADEEMLRTMLATIGANKEEA